MSNLESFCANVEKEFNTAGIQCSLTPIKNSKNKSPKVIVSFCAFRISDPYKDESVYMNGLGLLFDNFSKVMPNAVMRLFYDDSILMKDNKWKLIMEKGKTKDYVQLVHYSFPQFKMKDTFYHIGLFGTILRHFPPFDFIDAEEITMIDDIDYANFRILQDVYTRVMVAGLNVLKQSSSSVFLLNSYKIWILIREPRLLIPYITEKYDFSIRVLNRPTICKKKLDKQILINFMLCVLNKCNEYKDWIKTISENINCDKPAGPSFLSQCNDFKNIEESPVGFFLYGLDEYFLNRYMLGTLLETKQKFIIIYGTPDMTQYHYVIYLKFKEGKMSAQFMKDMYKFLLGRSINNDADIHKAFKEVDGIIFNMKDTISGLTAGNKKIIHMVNKIYEFLKLNAKFLSRLPDLNPIEQILFNNITNLRKSELFAGRAFREVCEIRPKHYELVFIKKTESAD